MRSVDNLITTMNNIDVIKGAFDDSSEECSMHEFRLLVLLGDQELRLKDIGLEKDVAPQGVGRMCGSLSGRGYVSITRCARDGRAKLVNITENGISLVSKCKLTLARIIESM